MTDNRIFPVLGVLLLVGLAGCSGIPFVGGGGGGSPDNSTTTTGIDYPYGWNESGIENHATHENNALLTANSLTFTFSRTVALADRPQGEFANQSDMTQTHRVDGVQEQWYITAEQRDVVSEYYYNGSTEFSRTAVLNENGSVQSETFSSTTREFNKTDAYQVEGAELLIRTTNYSQPEVTTYRGQEVIQYSAEGTERVKDGSPLYQLGTGNELTEFSSQLFVNKENGRILHLDVSVLGQRDDETFKAELSFDYSNFGNTTIEEPSWFDEANSSSTRNL